MIANNPAKTTPYVPIQDRALGEDQRTTFELRPLTLDEIEAWEDMQAMRVERVEGGAVTITHVSQFAKSKRLLVLAALVGWQNLRSPGGDLVQCECEPRSRTILGRACQPVREDLYARIPKAIRDELFNEVLLRSRLSEEDLGNLQSPQPQPSTAS